LEHILLELYVRTKDSLEMLEESNKVVSNFVKKKASGAAIGQVDSQKYSVTFGETYSSLTKIIGKKVYLVIYAIDECIDREKQSFLKTIRRNTGYTRVHISMVICSRPESDITNDLDSVPEIKAEENGGPDIRQNTTTELRKLPR
jgi:hypothetical protein